MKLKGKVALVTGGAGGVGSAICRLLASEGAYVAINFNSREKAALLLEQEIVNAGGVAKAFKADITDLACVKQLISEVVLTYGALDILVNNAGWTQVVPSEDLAGLTDELIQKTFLLKVNAPIYLAQNAREYLSKSNNANIINITSVAGIAARGSSLAYAAANAALSNLTRSLARTLAPQIRVNAVAPGFMETGFAYPADGVMAGNVSKNNFIGRCVTEDDVAAAVLFLCTDGRSITGEEIVVDGGIGRLGKK